METSVLRSKDAQILSIIVEDYLSLGKPVSSGAVFQKKRFTASSATIRNSMVRLEQNGYLTQPHTSAGRVPTDKGLRFYVNDLLKEMFFPGEEAPLFAESLAMKEGDFDSLLLRVSGVLAEHSDNLGFVISPRVSQVHFRDIRLLRISENRVLIILVTPFQMVLNHIVESRTPFTQNELDRASQYINMNFRGKNLAFVRDFLLQELPKYRLKYEDLINKISALVRNYISQEEGENRIFFKGTSRLLNKAELFDMEKLKALFQNFEEKAHLAGLLSEFISLDRVKVLIGSEVDFPDIQECSLVLSHYGYADQVLGSLGIIGPKRIPYEKIIPLVDSVAQRLSRAITTRDREVSI